MTPVVIDASAGAEMVERTRRGQALARLLPTDAVGWVPEHFYAEVASVLRRQLLVEPMISGPQALAALTRLRDWRLRSVGVRSLLDDAWKYRYNMTAADALYVVLAEHLGAWLLTDDHNLAAAPTFPTQDVSSECLTERRNRRSGARSARGVPKIDLSVPRLNPANRNHDGDDKSTDDDCHNDVLTGRNGTTNRAADAVEDESCSQGPPSREMHKPMMSPSVSTSDHLRREWAGRRAFHWY